jgi:hypothetical protein
MTSTLSAARRPSPSRVALLVGDGRPLLAAVAVALAASGVYAIGLGLTGQFLPHDVAWLGMDASLLCRIAGPNLDGVHLAPAFLGAAVLAVGVVLETPSMRSIGAVTRP